jgi:hypothetical protein
MIMFDASNRDQCEVKRLQTNTPLQALIMMNDPAVLEASRVLAQNLVREQSTIDQKLTKAFRLIICRKPTEKEQKILIDYYTDQLQQFRQKTLSAEATLAVGEYELDKKLDLHQSAALMKVVSMIYNLEEAIVK